MSDVNDSPVVLGTPTPEVADADPSSTEPVTTDPTGGTVAAAETADTTTVGVDGIPHNLPLTHKFLMAMHTILEHLRQEIESL